MQPSRIRLPISKKVVVRATVAFLLLTVIVWGFVRGPSASQAPTRSGTPLTTSTMSTTKTNSATPTPGQSVDVTDLPTQKMGQIISAYYLLLPNDVADNIRIRVQPLVSAKVLATLTFEIGTNSVADQARIDKRLVQKGTANLDQMSVISADGTRNNLYIIIPVTTQLFETDANGSVTKPYVSTDPAVPSGSVHHTFFILKHSVGGWTITNFGDERSGRQ